MLHHYLRGQRSQSQRSTDVAGRQTTHALDRTGHVRSMGSPRSWRASGLRGHRYTEDTHHVGRPRERGTISHTGLTQDGDSHSREQDSHHGGKTPLGTGAGLPRKRGQDLHRTGARLPRKRGQDPPHRTHHIHSFFHISYIDFVPAMGRPRPGQPGSGACWS